MKKEEVLQLFDSIRVYKQGDDFAVAKPALLLIALARCFYGKERLASINEYTKEKKEIPFSDKNFTLIYPFGRLSKDGLWEVKSNQELTKTSSGDLMLGEMNDDVLGGFKLEVFSTLSSEKNLIVFIAKRLIKKYLPTEKKDLVYKSLLRIKEGQEEIYQKNFDKQKSEYYKVQDAEEKKESGANFIAYLNSLHNIRADGANALAESQATNQYFGELYEPYPIAEVISNSLLEKYQRVIVLTGHAGDGKSTVALDVLKRLRGFPLLEPLTQSLKDLEKIDHPDQSGHQIFIVKDMSELSNEKRLEWISKAFHQPGSWLIVSNTGPLLNTLQKYASEAPGEIENQILACLDKPYIAGDLNKHTLKNFAKDLVILNMTRLENVGLGASLLSRMLKHSGWKECNGCSIEEACPLLLNRRALLDISEQAVERVRWVYQRLTAYEQRLTLRQMVAHLAFSLTGIMNCQDARRSVEVSNAFGVDRGNDGLGQILFSECFFGYRHGKPWLESQRLRAVELNQRQFFGSPVAVDFERQIISVNGVQWANLPDTLQRLEKHWRILAQESTGTHWRSALRRLLYFFATPNPNHNSQAAIYFDAFLQSPRLRDFDRWSQIRKIDFSIIDQKRLLRACLRVLLEIFSGFSAGQFKQNQENQEYLYITLRRPDRATIQPAQLVLAELPFKDFSLQYDPVKCLPKLVYKPGNLSLLLSLPLIDFIYWRHEGKIGTKLSQIHLAQLEWFRAELLKFVSPKSGQSEVVMLRVGINGEIHRHCYFLDIESNRLEIE
jgi:hypothetical protein